MTSVPDAVFDALTAIVGAAHVLRDDDAMTHYQTDWTGRFVGHGPAVVRPASCDEVAAVLAVCDARRVAVVPQGGNTGLVGGSVPLLGEIVLSLTRLDGLGEVDGVGAQVTAGAGVTLARLQEHAAVADLAYGVDLAARDSATVGGTIATNAGGMHLLRYGGTRQQVVGVEAVLADGRTLRHLGGLVKDNTGYDLPALLCGSEGTLAVVTAARLRLVPRYEEQVVAVLGFDGIAPAVEAVARWRRVLPSLDAAELFLADGLDLVRRSFELPAPLPTDWPVYVLVEASDHVDPTDALSNLVSNESTVRDAAVATDTTRRTELWQYREKHTLAINQLGPPHKLDVTLPLREVAGFIEQVPGRVASVAPEAHTWLFGHVGDGNIHVNVTGVEPGDERVDDAVLRLVAELGGSISAEHGIGSAKRRWLHLNRSAAEIDAFRAIKHALDPNGILNPHVLLPDP